MKSVVTEAVNEYFRPLRARRAEVIADPGQLRRVLRDGNERAAAVAAATLAEVRAAMGMDYTARA
jgi:tryptophanyl-tRNA synthetase